ncbi:IMP dehydrogenase, partial [Thermus scotoductus]
MVNKIIFEPGKTFSEFCLLTGHTREGCDIHSISLKTKLADNLILGVPFLSAAMTSVTRYELALALGKESGLGVLPVRLPIEEQAKIVKCVKDYEMGFVEDPVTVRENFSIEQVLRMMDRHGHSKIPIIDRYGRFKGMFVRQHYWEVGGSPQD